MPDNASQSEPTTRAGWLAPLVGYAFLNAAGAALLKGLGFLLFLWLAHALPVSEYARFGLLYALQSALIAGSTSGITESLVLARRSRTAELSSKQLLDAANGVFLFLTIGALVAAGALYLLITRPPLSELAELAFVLISGVLAAFFTLQAANVRLDEQHLPALGLSVVAPLIALFAAFAGFQFTRDVFGFFAGLMIGSIVAAAVFRYRGIGHFGLQPRWVATAPLRTQVPAFLSIALLSWLSGYGVTYAVQGLFQVSDVAKYTFLFTISAILQLVATAANQVWTPIFFRSIKDTEATEFPRQTQIFYIAQSFIVGFSGTIILIVLPFILDFAGGNLQSYRGLSLELYLLFIGYAVCTPWWHTQNHFVVEGHGQELNRIVLISSLLGLAAWAGLIALFGTTGIYAGFAAQMLIRSALAQYHAKRNWNVRLLWHGPVLATILLSLGAWGAGQIPL